MGCYENDAQTVCCAVCGRELDLWDEVVKLDSGAHICSDTDCLYTQALQSSSEDQLREYAALNKDVVIAGNATRAEIWDKDAYDKLMSELTSDMIVETMEQIGF